MKSIKFLPILSFLLIILGSCYKIIEVELPEFDQKPIVNCMFREGVPFTVNLSLPKEPLDTNEVTYIKDAKVMIGINDQSLFTLPYTGDGNYKNNSLFPQKGKLYTLKVEVPGYEFLRSTSQIPDTQTKIIGIEAKAGIKTVPVMGTGEEVRIEVQLIDVDISQDVGKSEYMGFSTVELLEDQEVYNWEDHTISYRDEYNIGYLESNDPAITAEGLEAYDYHSVLLFRDELFTKNNATISFNIENRSDSKFWCRFFQFSPEAFYYIKTWIIHDYTKAYDFWEVYEPLALYSNIENGYGIFAGYSSELLEVYPDSTQTFNQ